MKQGVQKLEKDIAISLNDAERDTELLREKIRCFIQAMARQAAREEYLKALRQQCGGDDPSAKIDGFYRLFPSSRHGSEG